MPKPNGWTDEMVARRDRCVEDVLAKGVPDPKTAEQAQQGKRERAFAICTASIERGRGT